MEKEQEINENKNKANRTSSNHHHCGTGKEPNEDHVNLCLKTSSSGRVLSYTNNPGKQHVTDIRNVYNDKKLDL